MPKSPPVAPPPTASFWSRAWAGARMVPAGAAWWAGRPGLWKYGVFAVVAHMAVLAALVLLGGRWAWGWWSETWPRPDGAVSVAWWLVTVLGAGILGWLAFAISAVIAPMIAAPFFDRLSERVELEVLGELPPLRRPGGPIRDLSTGIAHSLCNVVLWLGFLALGASLGAVPVVGPLLGPVVGWVATATLMALEFTDPALSRRRYRWAEKVALVRRAAPYSTGFGGALALLVAVPVLNLFVTPIAVTSGALLFSSLVAGGQAPPAEPESSSGEGRSGEAPFAR